MTIVAAPSVSVFFHEAVEGAMKSRGIQATEGATTYLVSLLADFAKPGALAEETLERPLVFLLDEALNTTQLAERFERLRTLGDGVLYSSGFFGDHFEKRGVDQSYLIGIGQQAYSSASSMLRISAAEEPKFDIYGELAEKFAAFVSIITEVAHRTIASGVASSKQVLRLYEQWMKTRSETLASALSAHGFDTRGKGLS